MAKTIGVKALPSADDKKEGFEEYEKEGFHRTLMEAEMIKNDPAKHKAAMEIMSKHKKAMDGMHMEKLVDKAANYEECDDCGTDMAGMSKAQVTEHNKSHESKKKDKKEDKEEGEEIS